MHAILALILCSVVLVASEAVAQVAQQSSGTAITQTGARGDVASRCDSISGTTQQTLTLQNPGPGLSNYMVTIGSFLLGSGGVITNAASAAVTTTGLNGTNANLGFPPSSATTAVLLVGAVTGGYVPLPSPIKANANTANAFIGPAAIANMTELLEVCYYAAP